MRSHQYQLSRRLKRKPQSYTSAPTFPISEPRHGSASRMKKSPLLRGCCLRLRMRENLIRPHHFVVFMFQDVAMPHIPPRVALESHDDPRHCAGVGAHGVFPSRFRRIGGNGFARKTQSEVAHVTRSVETAPV